MSRLITIVGKDTRLVDSVADQLREEGFHVETHADAADAKKRLAERPADVLLVEPAMVADAGGGLIEWALRERKATVAMALGQTATPMPAAITNALQFPDKVRGHVDTHEEEERAFWRAAYAPNLIGDSENLLAAIDILRNVADTDCSVMITGESGTGKELIARALHDASPRKNKPFVALNCAAIPENLMEAELFGHARGAFTGAHVAREGRFQVADGGTLFLDEIGDMPLVLQAKLLRVLQERIITPIGESHGKPVDVRVICATHRDVESLVAAGTFRADLYYRLNVIPIVLPSLRERRTDVIKLAQYFLERANQRLRRSVLGFDPAAEQLLRSYAWPGNVRELQNLVERMVVLKGRGTVTADMLSVHMPSLRRMAETPMPALARGTAEIPAHATPAAEAPQAAQGARRDGNLDLRAAQDELEKQLIQEALARSNGNRTEAAALLGLNRTTLVEKLRKIA